MPTAEDLDKALADYPWAWVSVEPDPHKLTVYVLFGYSTDEIVYALRQVPGVDTVEFSAQTRSIINVTLRPGE